MRLEAALLTALLLSAFPTADQDSAGRFARRQEAIAAQTRTPAARRASADAWLRAGNLALDRNQIRYTNEISRALVAAGDRTRLDDFFARALTLAGRGDATAPYLPLLDYADGLAAFGRAEAREYYRRAYEMHVNEAGLNKYVRYLLDQQDSRAALTVIEALSDDERRPNGFILSQWRRALQQAGRDTRPAEMALAEMERRSRGAQGGVFVAPSGK